MRRILVVDDDEFILLGLTKALMTEVREAEVLTALHGKDAVEILAARPVDAIVTDLRMPIMDGYEVVDYANRNFPCVPVYVMTGEYLPDITPRLRSAVVAGFISKPFSFRQLAAEISARLEDARV